MILQHFFNHIIGRANRVIYHASRLNDRIHFFVRLKSIIYDFDARFLLKHLRHFRVNILSGIVDVDHILTFRCGLTPRLRAAVLLPTGRNEQKQGKKECSRTRIQHGFF